MRQPQGFSKVATKDAATHGARCFKRPNAMARRSEKGTSQISNKIPAPRIASPEMKPRCRFGQTKKIAGRGHKGADLPRWCLQMMVKTAAKSTVVKSSARGLVRNVSAGTATMAKAAVRREPSLHRKATAVAHANAPSHVSATYPPTRYRR